MTESTYPVHEKQPENISSYSIEVPIENDWEQLLNLFEELDADVAAKDLLGFVRGSNSVFLANKYAVKQYLDTHINGFNGKKIRVARQKMPDGTSKIVGIVTSQIVPGGNEGNFNDPCIVLSSLYVSKNARGTPKLGDKLVKSIFEDALQHNDNNFPIRSSVIDATEADGNARRLLRLHFKELPPRPGGLRWFEYIPDSIRTHDK